MNATPPKYWYEPDHQFEREKWLFETIFIVLVGAAVFHAKRMSHFSN